METPSRFQIDDKVLFSVDNGVTSIRGKVSGVTFYKGKVNYELDLVITDNEGGKYYGTTIKGVDSSFVLDKIPAPVAEPAA